MLQAEAHAARSAKCSVDKVKILSSPKENADLIATLTLTDEIVASNYPTNGFHKVRFTDKKIGWISENDLILGPMPSEEEIQSGRFLNNPESGAPRSEPPINNKMHHDVGWKNGSEW